MLPTRMSPSIKTCIFQQAICWRLTGSAPSRRTCPDKGDQELTLAAADLTARGSWRMCCLACFCNFLRTERAVQFSSSRPSAWNQKQLALAFLTQATAPMAMQRPLSLMAAHLRWISLRSSAGRCPNKSFCVFGEHRGFRDRGASGVSQALCASGHQHRKSLDTRAIRSFQSCNQWLGVRMQKGVEW